jgi:hypothetical protein
MPERLDARAERVIVGRGIEECSAERTDLRLLPCRHPKANVFEATLGCACKAFSRRSTKKRADDSPTPSEALWWRAATRVSRFCGCERCQTCMSLFLPLELNGTALAKGEATVAR